MSAPRVSIVIVNYNGRHLLPDCLASLAALDYPTDALETIVVDNGSTDDSLRWLAAHAPGVRVLTLGRNVGFGEGCNRGAATARGDILAFLNPDTRADPGWLHHLTAPLGGDPARPGMPDPTLAATGARMLNWSGRALEFPVYASWQGMLYADRADRVLRRPDDYLTPQYLLAVCGGAMAIRRGVFFDVGGFDADYFMYHEDLDLGWRLWVQGYRVLYVPTAVVYHRSGGSGGERPRQFFLNERNALYTVVKNAGDAWLARLLPVLLLWLIERTGQYVGLAPGSLAAQPDGSLPVAHVVPDGAVASLSAGMDLIRQLPRLAEKRAAVQARRARSDEEIAALFDLPREVFAQMMLRADLDPAPALALIDLFQLRFADTTAFSTVLRGLRSAAATRRGPNDPVEVLLYLVDHSVADAAAVYGDDALARLAEAVSMRVRDLPVLARVLGLLGARGLAGLLGEAETRSVGTHGSTTDRSPLAAMARERLWRDAVFYKEELAKLSARRARRLRALASREARWRATKSGAQAPRTGERASSAGGLPVALRRAAGRVRWWVRTILPPPVKYWIRRVLLRQRANPWDIVQAPVFEVVGGRSVAPGPRAPRGDVIVLPVTDWYLRFQRPQHFAAQFAADGHRVYYVDVTFDPPAHPGDPPYRLTQVRPGVSVVRLPAPVALSVYRDRLAGPTLEASLTALEALIARERIVDAVVLVELPFWRSLAVGLRARHGWRVVYDCLDRHNGFSTNAPAMVDEEVTLVRECDLVVVSSRALLDDCSPHAARCVLIPNAADFRHFSAPVGPTPEALWKLPRPLVGYHGAIAEWFDASLVAGLARARPGWSVVLVGSTFTADLRPLAGLGNVHLTGEVPYAQIPAYVHAFDACIVPFRRLPLTEAADPVKVYEALAAGKPVISVPLPALSELADTGLVAFAADADGFVTAIEAALATDGPEAATRRRAFAAGQTWRHRYERLRDVLHDLHPRASIVIPTYNNLHLTQLCLDSILTQTSWPNYEVVVVDNGSTDGTPAYLEEMARSCPRVRYVRNEENEGFARAINSGIARSDGTYVVLLNNDTIVTRGWLSVMVRYLERHPDVGMIGPVTNLAGNEARIPVTYTTLEEMEAFAQAYTARHACEVREMEVLGFFCTVIPRRVLEQVGPLDERFETGMFEDDDFSLRVRRAGFRLVCTGGAFVHHFHSATLRQLGPEGYRRLFDANRARFEAKWNTRWRPHRDRWGP